jgi:Reverse transcriptase (RNA-dependent DNA polymerase)
MTVASKWPIKTFDFAQAFAQAPSEIELFIDVPRGCTIDDDNSKWVMQVVNNIYGQKQAARVCYRYLVDKVINELQFQQSRYDPCELWSDGCLIVIYTDNTIIAGSNVVKVDATIIKIANLFKTTSKDEVNDIGVNGKICLTQPELIQNILEDLGLKDNTKIKALPALSSKILQPHTDSPAFNKSRHYRSLIGKFNFLQKSTRPDIA